MKSNLAAYQSRRIVRRYSHSARDGLSPQEKECLELVPPASRGSVLDIGIGGGRTVEPLSNAFRNYLGIDYSEPMIAAARAQFPGRDLRVMDARRIDGAAQFDCAFFSFNGIDAVAFSDRQLIQKQIYQSLKTGGYFVYSTHNLQFSRAAIWLNQLWVKELVWPLVPWNKGWKKLVLIPNRLINFWRQNADSVNNVAYINDIAETFSYVHAYVDIDHELLRLKSIGFSIVAVMGNTKLVPCYDSMDHYVHIVAKKN